MSRIRHLVHKQKQAYDKVLVIYLVLFIMSSLLGSISCFCSKSQIVFSVVKVLIRVGMIVCQFMELLGDRSNN